MKDFWKDKNVTAYIALKHHTRFIIPIMENIAAMGANVKYLVGQAERSQEITAIEMGLDYSHIFEYLDDSDMDEIHENYHILRKTFAAALLKDKAFSLMASTVLDKTLFATAQEYIGFKNYVDQSDVDICIALHETNRWGKIFAYHAKKKSIPFITFQEGLYSTASAHYDFALTGHAQYSTFNFVWGERTRQKLANYEAPQEKIIPTGNTHITHEILRLKQNDIRGQKRAEHNHADQYVILLLFSINLIPTDELLPFFELFHAKSNQFLYAKFHPATVRMDIDLWITRIPEELKKNMKFIHGEENIYDLMAMSDLCVLTEGSTTGLEALAIGKPLVELNLVSPITYEFSLTEENAAIKLSPVELADAVRNKKDFSPLMNLKGVKDYIQSELYESEKSIETVTDTLQSVLSACRSLNPTPLESSVSADMKWSIILPIGQNSENLINTLESISINSEDENFEVILIRPETISQETDTILQSLEGDVSILTMVGNISVTQIFNQAGTCARGETLIFMDKNIVPQKNWLKTLKKELDQFGHDKLYGAKIINTFNNIVHAGIVVDANNCPVSAYLHLDKDFPHTRKTRSFQMIDNFMAVNKSVFLSAGGFDPLAGNYLFMDLCLRFQNFSSTPYAIIYLAGLELLLLKTNRPSKNNTDAIFFYSKWHGVLWENEKELYLTDGVSELQLNAARMTRALETANVK